VSDAVLLHRRHWWHASLPAALGCPVHATPRPRCLQIDGATFTCSVRVARAGVPAAVVLTAHGAGRHLLAVARLPADAQDLGGAPA